jgi:hypothetical protein
VEDKAATKDGIEVGDEDMTKDWNHGLMMITKVEEKMSNKGKEVRMILKHMANYKQFKFFHT